MFLDSSSNTAGPSTAADSACTYTRNEFVTCVANLSKSDVALREAHNRISYGKYSFEQSLGLPWHPYELFFYERSQVIQPASAFQFNSVEPEDEGVGRGLPGVNRQTAQWFSTQRVMFAGTELINRLLLGDTKTGIPLVNFLLQLATTNEGPMAAIRQEHLKLPNQTVAVLRIAVITAFLLGLLAICISFFSLEGVLRQVASTKVVVLKLFELIPLPVQRSLYGAAKNTLERFESLAEHREVGGDLGDESEDADLDQAEMDALIDNDSDGEAKGDAFGEDSERPRNSISHGANNNLNSSLFLRPEANVSTEFDESRKMSTFLFGNLDDNWRQNDRRSDVPVSILKQHHSGHRKKKVNERKKVQFIVKDQDDHASKAHHKLQEPKVHLRAKSNQLMSSYMNALKLAAEEEAVERRNHASLRDAEVDKLMAGAAVNSSAEAGGGSDDITIQNATRLNRYMFCFLALIGLLSLASAGTMLWIEISLLPELHTIRDNFNGLQGEIYHGEEAMFEQLLEARYYTAFGELKHYHSFFETSSSQIVRQSFTPAARYEESWLEVLGDLQTVSRALHVAMACAFRGLGVSPTAVPLLSTLQWEAPPQRLSKQNYHKAYPSLSTLLASEHALLTNQSNLEGSANVTALSPDGVSSVLSAVRRRYYETGMETANSKTLFEMTKVLRDRVDTATEGLLFQLSEEVNTIKDRVLLAHDLAWVAQVIALLPIAIMAVIRVVYWRSGIRTHMTAPLHLFREKLLHPRNAVILLIYILMAIAAIVPAARSGDVRSRVNTYSDDVTVDAAASARHVAKAVKAVDESFQAAAQFVATSAVGTEAYLGTGATELAALYDNMEAVALEGELSETPLPTKSQLLTSYRDWTHIMNVSLALTAAKINRTARIDATVPERDRATVLPYLTAYDITTEPNYAQDRKTYSFATTALQYTSLAEDLSTLTTEQLGQKAVYAFFGERSYDYHKTFITQLSTFVDAGNRGYAKRFEKSGSKVEVAFVDDLAMALLLFAVVLAVILQPICAMILATADVMALPLINHLHGTMRAKNIGAVIALVVVIILQFLFVLLSMSYPSAAAELMLAVADRQVETDHTLMLAERVLDVVDVSDSTQMAIYKRALTSSIDRLVAERSHLLSISRQSGYGKLSVATDAQNTISYSGPESVERLLQDWIDKSSAVAGIDPTVYVPAVSRITDPTTGAAIVLPTGYTSPGACAVLTADSVTRYQQGVQALRVLHPILSSASEASADQYLADLQSSTSTAIRIPAIVLLIVMLVTVIAESWFIFMPMVDNLVLEECGTSSLLGMIPPNVRPFVPKISQYLENGSLIKAEADAIAFSKDELVDIFVHQWGNGVPEETCFTPLNSCEHALILIDQVGTVVYINSSFTEMFLWTSKDLVGRNVRQLMNEPLRSMHDSFLERYLTQGTSRLVGMGRDVPVLCADGTLDHAYLNLVEATRETGKVFFLGDCQKYDVNKAKRAEEAM